MRFPYQRAILARARTASTALVLVAGCASREVPASFPDGAALAPEAVEPAPVLVTAALESDPPLPGERAAGWSGLDQRVDDLPKNELPKNELPKNELPKNEADHGVH